jgi:O-antigen ligase
MILLWAAGAWRSSDFHLNVSAMYLPLVGWIGIGLIQLLPLRDVAAITEILGTPASAALSIDQFATRFFVIRLFFYLVFFAAALTFVSTEKRLSRVAWFVILFGSLIAFFGILQWLARPDAIYGLRPTPQAIPFGPFVNQHHFAALMEMTGGLTLGVIFSGGTKKDKLPLLLIAVALMMLSVVLTGSRGGVISFAATAIFAMLATARYGHSAKASGDRNASRISKWVLPGGIVVAVLLLIAGIALFLGGEQSLLRGTGIENAQSDLTSGRAQFWLAGWRVFVSHPIIGTGFDTFAAAFTSVDVSNGLFRVEQVHNDYLQTLADGGLAGFACLAAFLWLLFSRGIAAIKSRAGRLHKGIAIGSLAGCFGIAVHSFVDFPLRTPANAFFFLMLAALATVTAGRDTSGTVSEP